MINTSKPSSSMTNIDRIQSAELWSTITTTWATETRTWLEAGQLLRNISRVTSSMTNTSKP